MKDNEYQLLLSACREVAKSYPRLQGSQSETVEHSAISIKEELEGFLGMIFQDREQIREVALETMQPLLSVFDLGLLQLCDLSHFAWQNHDGKARLIWPNTTVLPKRPRPTHVFYLLVSNLAQLLQATRLLLLSGFEGQSRAMVRNFIELADLTLAVVADDNIYSSYITTFEDEKKTLQHWRDHLSPGVIRRRLAKLDEELDIKSVTNIPAAEVRDDTYKWFSLFSHVNMAAHVVSVYPQPLDKQVSAPLAMLGEAGEMTIATFARVLLYLWLFFLNFDKLLWDKHHWDRFRGKNSRSWYQYRSKVFDKQFRENYALLQGISLEQADGKIGD